MAVRKAGCYPPRVVGSVDIWTSVASQRAADCAFAVFGFANLHPTPASRSWHVMTTLQRSALRGSAQRPNGTRQRLSCVAAASVVSVFVCSEYARASSTHSGCTTHSWPIGLPPAWSSAQTAKSQLDCHGCCTTPQQHWDVDVDYFAWVLVVSALIMAVEHVQAPPAPATAKSATAKDVCNVAVLGASGYTGAEVVRLSALHPNIRITTLTGDRQAGKVSSVGVTGLHWCFGLEAPCAALRQTRRLVKLLLTPPA